MTIWLQFAVCAALIAFGAAWLSRYGDVIAAKTGLSRSWIGLMLLATVTSLPELATGISAVAVADVPDIAVGNVLGACVINLAILVVLELLHRDESIYRRASQGHILSAAFGVVMIGVAGMNVVLGARTSALAIGHVGVYAPIIVALYLMAARTTFVYERSQIESFAEAVADRFPEYTLGQAAARFAGAALVVVAAGVWLPFIGAELARTMGWHGTFVGTLFVAGATTLPELSVTIASLRVGALDMAIANLLGSNLFNVLILAIDDLFYVEGPLLARVSPMHTMSATSATVMTGLVVVGLLYRPRTRLVGGLGWVGLGLFNVYLLNAFALYLHGD
jgi:cation:H+ antiporter